MGKNLENNKNNARYNNNISDNNNLLAQVSSAWGADKQLRVSSERSAADSARMLHAYVACGKECEALGAWEALNKTKAFAGVK